MQMTKRFNLTAAFLIILFTGIIIFFISKKDEGVSHDKMLKIQAIPFHTSAGWGYDVVVDNKTFIHQQFIPAIVGKQGFLTKDDALKTGNLVIEKMKNREHLAVTKNELVTLGISADKSLK